MKETDLKIQIPAQAWASMIIMMDIDKCLIENPNISLSEYVTQQKTKTNVWLENSDFHIYNHGTLFMVAYAFLVIPKESIEKLKIEVMNDKIIELLSKMNITTNVPQANLSEHSNIIRHLRNSISHVDYEIVYDRIFFIDKKNSKETFNGNININDFKNLLQFYYKEYYLKYIEKCNL